MPLKNIKIILLSLAVSMLALFGLHFFSQYEIGNAVQESLLRVAFRYQDNKIQTCRVYTELELQTIPVHMRKAELCELSYVAYTLSVDMDGINKISEVLLTGGRGHDRPLITMNEIKLSPGGHHLALHFKPQEHTDNPDLKSYLFEKDFDLAPGEIAILKFDGVKGFELAQELLP